MAFAIFDTGVYIDHFAGLHAETLQGLARRYVVRQSAVVLSELVRGARTRAAQRMIDALRRLAPIVWEPTPADWWTAGQLIRRVGDARDWDPHKRREFQNDALIALTARRHGATVVTTNATDFKLLVPRLRIELVCL